MDIRRRSERQHALTETLIDGAPVIRRPVSVLLVLSVLAGCDPTASDPDAVSPQTFSNPVISGFAPDPSITRVGSDFYLANSSFEYFPGIPIYHSNDLVNWELISYALHDPGQVDLGSVASSGGVHAPTIRYHDGTFYVIVTNIVDGRPINFIVTAIDPRGPWSQAFVLEDAPGIDPSLFFDDDGRVWYTGNWVPPDPEFPGQAEIWLQELDLDRMRLIGKKHYLWRGCCQGTWAEGPHLYKKDGYYYLLISEGGTSYEHALSIAISKSVTGPYQNNPRNPILTHRQLSYDHPITGVGHADLLELQDGRWYAVALGWRLIDGAHGILGRETFLVPVIWETERHVWKEEKLSFPVISPESGRIELHHSLPFPGTVQRKDEGYANDFSGGELGLEWNFRRTPSRAFHSLGDNPGSLRLFLQPTSIEENAQYSFVGIRQRHLQFEATTRMSFAPAKAGEEAGLVVMQNDRSAFVMTLTQGESGSELRLYHAPRHDGSYLARQSVAGDGGYLKVTGDYLSYSFSYSPDGEEWTALWDDADGRRLSPAVIGGFNYTGVYIGLYASSNGQPTDNHADFDWFRYRPTSDNHDGWYYRNAASNSQAK